ncbi:hypothetical protein [Caloranaerobacter sp. DY30410]|uniref:hypothetical protein n=1 Tax=Caloranaerobacter sp. DY30410 TaxID=3238305 RepID=UPI003CFCE0D3
MINYIIYIITFILLGISFKKDKQKTKKALKKSWKAFSNILPEFLGVIILVGVFLSIFNADVISRLIGKESGWVGIIASAVVGAITLIPGFVAFPTAALLLQNGAGYMQIGAFISALMMVGIITMPVENRYFGKKLTILRNSFAFLFSFLVAYVIGKVVGGI